MTTPNTDLVEQIAEAINPIAWNSPSRSEGWDPRPALRGDALRVLPIVEAAVKRGQAEALRSFADDYQDNADHNTPADIDPDLLRDRADTIEKEAHRGD